MTPVVRVVAAPVESAEPPLPHRLRLGLAELVTAAGLAGDVPLPIGTNAPHLDDRLIERLDGTRATEARVCEQPPGLRIACTTDNSWTLEGEPVSS